MSCMWTDWVQSGNKSTVTKQDQTVWADDCKSMLMRLRWPRCVSLTYQHILVCEGTRAVDRLQRETYC